MYKLRACSVLECSVDWLTATVSEGSERRRVQLAVEDWAIDRSTEGYRMDRWAWNGYIGSFTDGISFGKRDDGLCVRLSGSMAQRHWATLATWATNISRFDIQSTLLSAEVRDEHASHGFALLSLDPRVTAGIITTKLVEATPSGSTLYVGSRRSNRMFRLYDKTSESSGEYPDRSWRYEIEYKGDRAKRVAGAILADRHETQAIFDCIQSAYGGFGLEVPADRPAWAWRDAGVAHVTDDQRRLEWLGRCIRPCVSKLTEAFGTDTVLAHLGITSHIDELTGELEYTVERPIPMVGY